MSEQNKSRTVKPEAECIPVPSELVTFLPALINCKNDSLTQRPPSSFLDSCFLARLFDELMQKFCNNRRPSKMQ
jgi:hypothetical protein